MYHSLRENGLTLNSSAIFCGGTLNCAKALSGTYIYGVSTDSRTVKKNDLFFAIKGENFDGFDYIGSAVSAGAACVVTDRRPGSDIPYILVKDTVAALGAFAGEYKKLFNIITVAVTGSVGKTTTKQFIYSVLNTRWKTLGTEGNFNNNIGLPKTLLSLDSSYKMMVVEMGMSARGEISALSKIAAPDISVITNIGNCHIESLGSRENIRDAKLEITGGMRSGALLLLNGDEPLLTDNPDNGGFCRLYFGINNPCCNYRADNIRREGEYTCFDLHSSEGDILSGLKIRSFGKHLVYDAMIAAVCGILLGVEDDDIREGLLAFKSAAMRQNIIKRNGYTIIEDCYNANPESMKASLSALSEIADGRKIAVLGDMRELGSFSPSLHRQVGEAAVSSGVDYLVTVGAEAREIARGARTAGMNDERIISFDDYSDEKLISENIKKLLREGDTVLIKASRALSLERISNLL